MFGGGTNKPLRDALVIVGIGNDICDVRRIRASLERHGERFAARILSDAEMKIWRQRAERWPERGVRYVATRFSVKESFSKAIGLGMRLPMTWRDCLFACLLDCLFVCLVGCLFFGVCLFVHAFVRSFVVRLLVWFGMAWSVLVWLSSV